MSMSEQNVAWALAAPPGHGDSFGDTVVGEWPSWLSTVAICIVALGVGLAAASSNQGNKREKAK